MLHLEVWHLLSLSLRAWVCHPNTCIYVRLLGPCFKTGRLKPLCQHPKHGRAELTSIEKTRSKMHVLYTERSHSTQSPCPRAHAAKASVHSTVSLQSYNTAEGHLPQIFFPQTKLTLTCRRKSASQHKDETRAALRSNLYHSPMQRLISQPHDWFQTFPFQQFHVLFNSLFKVLFIFPSRYLFAIGLSPIFSFRWNLPPILGCIPKQPDSLKTYHIIA